MKPWPSSRRPSPGASWPGCSKASNRGGAGTAGAVAGRRSTRWTRYSGCTPSGSAGVAERPMLARGDLTCKNSAQQQCVRGVVVAERKNGDRPHPRLAPAYRAAQDARDTEIFKMVRRGMTHQEISIQLGIARNSVGAAIHRQMARARGELFTETESYR